MQIIRQKFGTRPVRIIDRARQAELRESGGRALFFLCIWLFLWACSAVLGDGYSAVRLEQYAEMGAEIPELTRFVIRMCHFTDWPACIIPAIGALIALLIWRSRIQPSRRLLAILVVFGFVFLWGAGIVVMILPLFVIM